MQVWQRENGVLNFIYNFIGLYISISKTAWYFNLYTRTTEQCTTVLCKGKLRLKVSIFVAQMNNEHIKIRTNALPILSYIFD